MTRTRHRRYDASTIADGINVMQQIRDKVIPFEQVAAQITKNVPAPQPEMLEGHCTNCKTKRQFAVEGEEKMKNGAIRKYGKCTEPGCSRTISHFVSGVKDAVA